MNQLQLAKQRWKLLAAAGIAVIVSTLAVAGTATLVSGDEQEWVAIVKPKLTLARACRGPLTVRRLLSDRTMEGMGHNIALFMLSAISGDMRRSCARMLAPGLPLAGLAIAGSKGQLAWVDDPNQCVAPISCITVIGEAPPCEQGVSTCTMLWGIHTPRFGYMVYEVRMDLTGRGWKVGYATRRSESEARRPVVPGPFAS